MMIDEKSKVSLGIAISLIGGGAMWLTTIAVQTAANAKTLEALDLRQIKYNESIQTIERDLAIIRTKLEWMSEKTRRGK